MSELDTDAAGLFDGIRCFINKAKQRAAAAVNTKLTLLYWQVGQCIHRPILNGASATG